MKVSIVGCGLIGRKRALSIDSDDTIVACCDSNPTQAQKFANEFNCSAFSSIKEFFKNFDSEIIVIAVINKFILPYSILGLEKNAHILAEKPLGRDSIEPQKIVLRAKETDKLIKTGFNHRFHPAIWKAREMLDQGKIGSLLFVRGRYGHGSRPGMEKEWRSSKDLCGGGELLDQGVHLIDLSHWFAGEMRSAFGKVRTKFWPIEVEDNAFILLESYSGADIQLHVSWTNWKNIFSFELFGSDGYLKIEGLGGSYGPETLEFGKRKKEGGKPDIEFFEFPPEDISWIREWQEFKAAIRENRQPIGNGEDGLRANQVIEALYKSSSTGQIITLNY